MKLKEAKLSVFHEKNYDLWYGGSGKNGSRRIDLYISNGIGGWGKLS